MGVTSDTSCVGCLGDSLCWVCLGHGHYEGRLGSEENDVICRRCSGSGICTLCTVTIITAKPIPRERRAFRGWFSRSGYAPPRSGAAATARP